MGCCASSNRNGDSRSPYQTSPLDTPNQPTDSRTPIAHGSSQAPQNVTQASASSLVVQDHQTSGRSHSLLASGHPRGTSTTHPSPLREHASSPADPSRSRSSPNTTLQAAPASNLIATPTVSVHGLPPAPAKTVSALRVARDEFFDTRVSGRSEMWAAVRLMAEMIEAGELAGAQAVQEAAGLTCPSGHLWGKKGGCYDERGERYSVPAWCVGAPAGLVDDVGRRGESADKSPLGRDELQRTMSDGAVSATKKGKGKVVADSGAMTGKPVKVKVRFSHTAKDAIVKVGEDDLVELLASRAKDVGELPRSTRVRLIHLGRPLDEQRTLSSQEWREGHVINMFVFE